MRRAGGDAATPESTQERLLMPLVLGLAGDFDNAGVRSTAISLFQVGPALHTSCRQPSCSGYLCKSRTRAAN